MKPKEIDRIECAIRHIQTATDVDPWAMEIAVEAMKEKIDRDSATCINPEKMHDRTTGDSISRQAAIDGGSGT